MAAPPASPMLPRPCCIRRVVAETHDTFTFEIDAPGATFEPGQFAMLYVFGVGEVPISFSGDPGRAGRLVHTTREVGTVTRAMRGLKSGAWLGLRGPYGRPWPLEQARGHDVVLVAGGIGLAPLRPVVYAIAARRAEYGRVVVLLGARSPADVLFQRELERWRAVSGIEVRVTVDHGTRTWPGDVGVVTDLIPGAPVRPEESVALVCGPEVMMRFAAAALASRGVRAERVFVSLERNMKCAVGLCGRCQFGPELVCRDGPVFPYERVRRLLDLREV